ncbi:hypothetical protein [Agrococcus sp. ARC_14]|uniref:hypothetical protein n=1 Tax=Agrococcus sp. ARC_14 TaxID=2919927 RepID=UPI001F05AB7E|nr:hypothetical protein [Agrococcus sp. ARC_14]MCH1882077.1 hypothetical protein [Agrococcus sp. ARC_14]
MTDALRTLHLPLPEGWEVTRASPPPPLPWIQHHGIAVEALHNAAHVDGSELALYALRAPAPAIEKLSRALTERLGAIPAGRALCWGVAAEHWVSLSALLDADAVQGPAVLCTTRFSKAAAESHVEPLTAALDRAEWQW